MDTLSNSQNTVPELLERDVRRAVKILREAGCSEVFLFGSGATDTLRADSDLDLAVRGCPSGNFFQLLGRLLLELDCPVDLVNLDRADPFAEYLQKEGALVRVG
ncbi:MAG TPA: nucleotidyltransferase domain-containing protein [Anaerolineae bacterium]|nr:nucleotidyltransferase domain-containing protein [Anaerolineae bacterium]